MLPARQRTSGAAVDKSAAARSGPAPARLFTKIWGAKQRESYEATAWQLPCDKVKWRYRFKCPPQNSCAPPYNWPRGPLILPSLKLTANAPENGGPLESQRFRTWKAPFLGEFAVSFREGIRGLGLMGFRVWVLRLQDPKQYRIQSFNYWEGEATQFIPWFWPPKNPVIYHKNL